MPEPTTAARKEPDVVRERNRAELDLAACRLALGDAEAEIERLRRIEEAARRLRQWDIIAGPNTFSEGEFTADAPYWRAELDRVLAPEPSDA